MTDDAKIAGCDSWRVLEKLAFRGRQGEVKAFVCIALMGDGTCAEVLFIPEDERVRMCGLASILATEVQTLVPIADLAEIGIDE